MTKTQNALIEPLSITGPEAAFLAAIFAAAGQYFRDQGNGLVKFASKAPTGPAALAADRRVAQRAVHRTGLAAVAVADAIDQALVVSTTGDIDALRVDQFDEAAAAFADYAVFSAESVRCFERIETHALAMTPPAGRA